MGSSFFTSSSSSSNNKNNNNKSSSCTTSRTTTTRRRKTGGAIIIPRSVKRSHCSSSSSSLLYFVLVVVVVLIGLHLPTKNDAWMIIPSSSPITLSTTRTKTVTMGPRRERLMISSSNLHRHNNNNNRRKWTSTTSSTVSSSSSSLSYSDQLQQQQGVEERSTISSQQQVDDSSSSTSSSTSSSAQHPYIRSISSFNLAGAINREGSVVKVPLLFYDDDYSNSDSSSNNNNNNNNNLIAVTGETGSGKSLLVARAIEVLTGRTTTNSRGSAGTLSLLLGGGGGSTEDTSLSNRQNRTAYVQMEMVFPRSSPQTAVVEDALQSILGDDDAIKNSNNKDENDDLVLKFERTLLLQQQPASTTSTSTTPNKKPRLKSICKMNDQVVTLKSMSSLLRPLVALVDAATASNALSNPSSRMLILDAAIPDNQQYLANVQQTQKQYRQCRRKRIDLERELASRTLPASFLNNNMGGNDDNDNEDNQMEELLDHWITELDAFENRVIQFCNTLLTVDGSDGVDGEEISSSSSSLPALARQLASTEWLENENNENNSGASSSTRQSSSTTFSSLLLRRLSNFRDQLIALNNQRQAAQYAIDALGSLSSSQSAITAVEDARRYLFDATASATGGASASATINNNVDDGDNYTRIEDTAERAHDLLNAVEEALKDCTNYIEDDDRGLLRAIEKERSTVRGGSLDEEIDMIVYDWNTLSRKHGVPAPTLPSCHAALKAERDGNVEARELLPRAIADEKDALIEFESACQLLSEQRQIVANRLSDSVTDRLPSLGMDDKFIFRAQLNTKARKCTDASAYSSGGGKAAATSQGAVLGLDSVDFVLLRRSSRDNEPEQPAAGEKEGEAEDGLQERSSAASATSSSIIQGQVHEVASSGEKARILLAIECALPGSVGASCCGVDSLSSNLRSGSSQLMRPMAVIYDEIDAHVGGRASVALADMLADQSRQHPGHHHHQQVIAITHSPSVAAVADSHVVVRKLSASSSSATVATSNTGNHQVVEVNCVRGTERRKELARMAGGDLAIEEAEVFADALIRDARAKKSN